MKVTKHSAVEAYKILNTAKLSKMENADKFSVVKALRALKPVAKEFDAFVTDTAEKLKPEDFDAKIEKARNKELTPDEIDDLNRTVGEYNRAVEELLEPEREKEDEIRFEPLGREAFEKLIESNPDYDARTIMLLEDVLVG